MYGGEVDLKHKSRKLIYNYILSNPGVTFGNIMRFLDINKSTLMYHLTYLEKARKVFSIREGHRRYYYCIEKKITDIDPFFRTYLNKLNTTQIEILKLIKDNPGITKQDLIIRTRINRKNLNNILKKLGELNLIWLVKNSGILGYEYVTREKLRSEVLKRLITKLISDEIDEKTFKRIKKKLKTINLDEIEI
jgi:predicted transcriptional regulator